MEINETGLTIAPAPKDKAPVWVQLFIALFYFSILIIASSMGGDDSSSMMQQIKDNPQMIYLMQGFQAIGVIIAFILPPALFAIILRKEKFRFLQLNKRPRAMHLLIGATICIIAIPLVSGTAAWNMHMHLPSFLSGVEEWMRIKEKAANEMVELFFLDKSLKGMFLNLFIVAFMAGLSEEIFFRGFIQRLFIDNKMNVHLAVWITAILFSAIHIQFLGFIPRMLLGAVLGYLYAYTNNLWISITAHTVNNAFAVVMAYITGSISDDPMSGKDGGQVSLSLVGLSVMLVGGMIWFLHKRSSPQPLST